VESSADELTVGTPHQVAVARSPYLGLVSYSDTTEDAALFCGRETERDLVIDNLRAARVTVLYGTSGIGKSSLLHAGVAPRLRSMDRPAPVILIDDWVADPAVTLTRAMARVAQEATGPVDDRETAALAGVAASTTAASSPRLVSAGATLDESLDALREHRARAPLIILDRFEDYLRRREEGVSDALAEVLATLVSPPGLVARVLIAVRDDRLADLDRLEEEIPSLFGNVLRLEPMTPAAAARAITGPLDRYNALRREAGDPDGQVLPEPNLVEYVVDRLAAFDSRRPHAGDVSDTAAASDAAIEPALLSLTMRQIWDADVGSGGHTLRRSTLEQLGDVAGIFGTHLDGTMGRLSDGEQRMASEMVRYLVTPSGATQRLSVVDLADYVSAEPPVVEALADKLSEPPARILRTAMTTTTDDKPLVTYELSYQMLARSALEWRTRYLTRQLERRARHLLLALVSVTAIAVALAAYVIDPAPLQRLELSSVDARFSIRGPQPPDRRIVLVGIDAHSALAPLHRALYAAALRQILAARPRLIVFDVIFDGSGPAAATRGLIGAVDAGAGRLVLAADELDTQGETMLFGRPDEIFTDRSTAGHPVPVGYAGFPIDSSSSGRAGPTIRTMERGVSLPGAGAHSMRTLAVVAAGLAGGPRGAPALSWIDFLGGAGTFPSVSFADVRAGKAADLNALRNRIVVVGAGPGGGDPVRSTSAPGHGVMSGPELQAEAISTALRGYPLRSTGLGIDITLIVALGLVPLALALTLPVRWWMPAVLLSAVLYGAAAQLAFDGGRVLNVVYPLGSLVVSAAGVLAVLKLRRRVDGRHPSAVGSAG
jgi:CHASE2 domain-containing sensor protein